jgi:hypothetical protein
MTKREQRRADYTADCQRERERAEARAAIHQINRALFACLQLNQSVDDFNWHKLASDCRKAINVDDHTVQCNLGKRALWRTESEWQNA